MRVLVAPDKFKGSLTGADVAAAIARGLASRGLRTELCPVADGGDGTVDAAVAAGFERRPATASGPTGRPVATAFARSGGAAVVELADVCGLVRLPDGVPHPEDATTYGLGEVLRAALDDGARRLVVGLGGSASTDGGAGLAQALGAVLLAGAGAALPDGIGGGRLAEVARVDLARWAVPDGVTVEVACDVDNPLLGPHGAAAVYGPQKGADEAAVARLDAGLASWARVLGAATGTAGREDEPGAGAAGGVGYGVRTLLDARLRPGFDLVAELLGFDDRLAGADLVVTGEGRLDAQTLHGKGPAGVAARAAAAGIPVLALAGSVALDAEELRGAGITAAAALADVEPDPDRSRAHAAELLEHLAATVPLP
ncbi:glycerate kinase [Actinomycetospora sp. TBRC 11914]|uniref:glycerate kinase n=1 Tax=Actinomycetospora sp. TBRC 11914 TaxID=2729387 RepID=UPI00145DE36C|nr:glycerate kinase [Actinomycetospora sp. TBRC 11914]NMO94126.1 glycerate kinase [Actinomycetospora sp. TBRC 11914]